MARVFRLAPPSGFGVFVLENVSGNSTTETAGFKFWSQIWFAEGSHSLLPLFGF